MAVRSFLILCVVSLAMLAAAIAAVVRQDRPESVAGSGEPMLPHLGDYPHVEGQVGRPEAARAAEQRTDAFPPARDLFVPVGLGDQGKEGMVVAGAEGFKETGILKRMKEVATSQVGSKLP